MYDVLETCDEAGWEEREKHWIAYGRAQGWPLENIAKGGNGWPAGSRHSDQTRAKIGDIVRLRLTDPKARAKFAGAWRGQKHSQEARAKIAKSVRQRFTDPTERDKHAEAQRGRMANPKEREKLAEAARQQWADPKVRATMVDAQRLRWLDPKEREKMVGINSGRTHTEEARANMATAAKRRCSDPKVRAKMAELARQQWADSIVRAKLVEAISENDETLLNKYLAGEEIPVEDLKRVLRQAVIDFNIVPVLCGSALKNKGVQFMLDAVVDYLPNPLDIAAPKAVDPDDKTKEILHLLEKDSSVIKSWIYERIGL